MKKNNVRFMELNNKEKEETNAGGIIAGTLAVVSCLVTGYGIGTLAKDVKDKYL